MASKKIEISTAARRVFAAPCITVLCATAAWCAPPSFEIRMGSGERGGIERYAEYGYNVAVLGNATRLAAFADSAPAALPPGSALRKAVEESRRHFREQARAMAALGIKACVSTDEILLPSAVLETLGKRITRDDDPRRVDFNKEAFWELYRAKYREMLREFPEIAYVKVRTGENYSFQHNGYSGQLIAENTSQTTRSEEYIRNMQRLINETRKVVVDEFGRKLIWRTWDLGNYGFHANPEVYDRVLAGVRERKGLIFAVKFTQTDFWRYNDFNPTIGRGGVDQIIEFQAAREYEGKGAYPNYVGEEHAAAIRRCRELGVKGIWVWNFGGGWDGPRLKTDVWVRANIHATARLAQDPYLEPRRLAEEWAAKEFGKAAAPKIAEMLLLSDDCVLGFRYIAPYSRRHKGWLPARNFMRDDVIRGEREIRGAAVTTQGGLKLLYEGSRDALDEALEEKAKAARLATRMREIFESARPAIVSAKGERVYDEARSGLLYVESLARVVSHYIRGMFLYYRWQENGVAETARAARTELMAWRAEWRRYQDEIPKLPGAATLYRSISTGKDPAGAMEDTCERALEALR